MKWSFDSNFLATKNGKFHLINLILIIEHPNNQLYLDATPNVIWIWQVSSLSLHTVIIQISPIKSFTWSPTDHMLLICTENSNLYCFTLSQVYIFEINIDSKKNLAFNKIAWSEDGKFFILHDKNHFTIGNPLINNENKIEEIEEEHEPDQEQESNMDYRGYNESNNLENDNNYIDGEQNEDENYNNEEDGNDQNDEYYNNKNYNNNYMNNYNEDENEERNYNEQN